VVDTNFIPIINNPLNNVAPTPYNQTDLNPGTVETQQQVATDTTNTSDAAGRRVRLSPKPGGSNRVYGDSELLHPVKNTNGIVWPYQPVISYQGEVDYKSMEMTHSIQDMYAYHRTQSVKLTVDGEFSVQNQKEGLYALSCIHFLRTVTKMHFGETDPNKGTPPPVLNFHAYGSYMFNALPVIVNQFSITLPKDIDYLPVDVSTTLLSDFRPNNYQWVKLTQNYLNESNSSNYVWLPAVFNITVSLIVQQSPTKLRSFNLEKFRSGSLVKSGGWI